MNDIREMVSDCASATGATALGQDAPPRAELLAVAGISRRFGATHALRGVDLTLRSGEIVALLGANGAGKSTLIKILAGVQEPSSGVIRLGNQVFERGLKPADAQQHGLGFVHQDLGLIRELSVAENIGFVQGFETRQGMISWSRQRAAAREILQAWELDIPGGALVGDLEAGQQSLVAIARALAAGARVIVLDEPTATLPAPDVAMLADALRRLCERGVGILYVTHHLREARQLADRIMVLRDGAVAGSMPGANATEQELVRLIVGSAAPSSTTPDTNEDGLGPGSTLDVSASGVGMDPSLTGGCLAGVGSGDAAGDERHSGAGSRCALQLTDVSFGNVRGLDLEVRRGEILGLVGLVGAGQREVGRGMAGALPLRGGAMTLNGSSYAPRTPREAQQSGITFLPGDRLTEAGFPNFDVVTNFHLRARLPGWLHRRVETAEARSALAAFAVKPSDPSAMYAALSGGNQQKLLLAKWILRTPRVFVAEEPLAGVDVGARMAIGTKLRQAAAGGCAIVLVSSNPEDVVNLAQRTVVFRHGEAHVELLGIQATVDRIALEVARR